MNKENEIKEMASVMCDDCRKTAPNCKYSVCNSVMESATTAYNAGYRKQEWISVEERLPEIEQIVLCCLGLVQNVYTYKGDNIWEDSYGYYQKDEPITHWMKLPEIPKGEENG